MSRLQGGQEIRIDYDQFAEIYDDDMGRNIGDTDVAFYLQVCGGCSPILELGCGTGRIMEPFAARGVRIVGLDTSRRMLDRAHLRLSPYPAANWSVVPADMADFALNERFQCAICAFSTYSKLLTKRQQASFFRCVRAHLEPGGRIALDMFVQTSAFDALANGEMMDDYRRRWSAGRGCFVSRSKRVWKDVAPSVNRIELTYTFETDGPEAKKVTTVMTDYTRYSTPAELETLLRRHGFAVEHVYGGFDGEPFGAASTRMIVVGRAA